MKKTMRIICVIFEGLTIKELGDVAYKTKMISLFESCDMDEFDGLNLDIFAMGD